MSTDLSLRRFAECCSVGFLRGLLSLPLEQPLDRIKIHLQAHPQNSSILHTIKSIYQLDGFKGFYKGGSLSTLRLIVKPIYRFFVLLGTPYIYSRNVSFEFRSKYPRVENAVTSLSLATLETSLVTPLESARVWWLTSSQKVKLNSFLKQKDLMHTLYRGWSSTFLKVSLSTMMFLTSYDFFKTFLLNSKKDKKALSPLDLFVISVPVGATTTLSIMPFDVVATRLQQAHAESSKLFPAIIKLAREHNFVSLFRGWQIKLAQSILQAALTVPLLGLSQQHMAKAKDPSNKPS